MNLQQNDLEHLKDLMTIGNMTADQANVEMVRMARVRIIVASMPMSVRKALNTAVKNGELNHKTKNGKKPEVYYHPNFEHLANAERNQVEKETIEALLSVCCAGVI